MSAAEDMELLRRGYGAWNTGDVDRVVELMDPDVVLFPVLGDVVAADSFHGRDGVRQWYQSIHDALDDFRAELREIVDAGAGRYVALLRASGRGKASGAEVSLDMAHVVTVRDRLLTRLEGYQSWEEALRAAGIRESA